MPKETRNFLVHIELHDITTQRLTYVGPRITDAMLEIGGKQHEMVWRSLDRSVLAYVIQTARTARQIVNRLTLPSDPRQAEWAGVPKDKIKDWGGSVLSAQDKIAVLELGTDTAETGYGRLAGWITGHQS